MRLGGRVGPSRFLFAERSLCVPRAGTCCHRTLRATSVLRAVTTLQTRELGLGEGSDFPKVTRFQKMRRHCLEKETWGARPSGRP